MPLTARLLTALFCICLSFAVQAEKLRIVTDPWAPYAYQENGQNKGLDYETTTTVFQRLGVEIEWQFLPWKRCLAMLEQGHADGILDIFRTSERASTLFYPHEALSDAEFVLFYAKANPHPVHSLEDLRGLNIGTTPGYVYSEAFNGSTQFVREDAPTQEANFGKLQRGRIDLLITDRRVGQYMLDQLQLRGQIEQHALVISRQSQYLALRRNAGMDLLLQRFNAELKRFKSEPAYGQLLARYTGGATSPRHDPAVEQQESSAR